MEKVERAERISELLEVASDLCWSHDLVPIGVSGGEHDSKWRLSVQLSEEDFERLILVGVLASLSTKAPTVGDKWGRFEAVAGDIRVLALYPIDKYDDARKRLIA